MKYATIEILHEKGRLGGGGFVIRGIPPNGNYFVREFDGKKKVGGKFHQYLHDAVAHVELYQDIEGEYDTT